MKLLAVAIMLLAVSVVQANDERKYQNFYRAAEGSFLIQGGYEFLKLNVDYSKKFRDVIGRTDVERSWTNTNFRAEYGILKNLAVGVELTHQREPESEGMNDHELFARGQYNSFFYEFRYFYSFEDSTFDNTVSGGSHYMVELGYVYNGFGIKYNITPTYNYEFVDKSAEYKKYTDTALQVFYEHILNDNTYGVALTSRTSGKSEDDGIEIIEKAVYGGFDLYAAIPVGPVTLLPAYRYSSLRSNNDTYDEFTQSSLELKARYEF
jgi:hypothetical protein